MEQADILLPLNSTYNTPYLVRNGVNIRGTGPLCTSGRGTNVVFNNCDGFVFGTVGDPYQQTGGSLERVHVIKGAGVGGTGVALLAPTPDMRTGETAIDASLIHGQNGAAWQTGILIDGSNLTTPGSAGVRRTIIGAGRGVRVHGANIALHAKNAVHLCVSNFQSDPGGGTGQARVQLDGGQNLMFNNLIINGTLDINGSFNLSLASSFIDTIIVRAGSRGVTINCTCNNLIVENGSTGFFNGYIHVSKTAPNTGFIVIANR